MLRAARPGEAKDEEYEEYDEYEGGEEGGYYGSHGDSHPGTHENEYADYEDGEEGIPRRAINQPAALSGYSAVESHVSHLGGPIMTACSCF